MCNPVAIGVIGLAISAAGEGYQATVQNQQADQQRAFNEAVQKEGQAAAQKAFAANSNAVQTRMQQQTAAASQQTTQNHQRAIQAMGRARTAAGQAGVSGLSVDSLLGDFSRQQQMYDASVSTNLQYQKQQDAFDLQGLKAQEQSQIASSMRPDVIAPGYLGAGLRIGGDALGSYNTYEDSTMRAQQNTQTSI